MVLKSALEKSFHDVSTAAVVETCVVGMAVVKICAVDLTAAVGVASGIAGEAGRGVLVAGTARLKDGVADDSDAG